MSKKNVPVKYTSRDFASIKRDLLAYAKRYYPDTYKDFSDSGFGSLVTDWVALIGDMLSFQVDYEANESYLSTAVEYGNILKHGRTLGYNFDGIPSSYGEASFFVVVPAATNSRGANTNYLPVLKKGSVFETASGTAFISNENIDFAYPGNEVVVANVNSVTGLPTHYAVKAKGEVVSGIFGREAISVGSFRKFLQVKLSEIGISEIVSVVDEEGHEYYQVDYLSQDTIYKPLINMDSSTNPYATNILRPVVVPRRYVVKREVFDTYLQFGSGEDSEITTPSVVDPSSVVLQKHGRDYISDDSFDPSNLISTDTLGVGPSNTRLYVTYRKNTTGNVNASVDSLNTVNDAKLYFKNEELLDADLVSDVLDSIEVTNEKAIVGDITMPKSDELKSRIMGMYARQNRAVTKLDYLFTVYAMPAKFGLIKKANVVRDEDSFKRNINVYVLSEDENGYFTEANSTIKENLRFWLMKNKMINDTVDILDAKIINLEVKFTISTYPDKNKYDVLAAAETALKEYYGTTGNVGEPFMLSEARNVLINTSGVLNVLSLSVDQKTGTEYSSTRFSLSDATSEDGTYINAPENVVFEIKYKDSDIIGSVV